MRTDRNYSPQPVFNPPASTTPQPAVSLSHHRRTTQHDPLTVAAALLAATTSTALIAALYVALTWLADAVPN